MEELTNIEFMEGVIANIENGDDNISNYRKEFVRWVREYIEYRKKEKVAVEEL